MSFPQELRHIFSEVGQAAAEIPCLVDGCREFVSVYAFRKESFPNFEQRFPYLSQATEVFRAIRFRVKSFVIEEDIQVDTTGLAEYQVIYLPSEEAVEYILQIWKVSLNTLRSPRDVEIPV